MLLSNRETKDEEEKRGIASLQLPLYLNLSLAMLRLERPLRSLDYSLQALIIDPRNTKALFRCGQVTHTNQSHTGHTHTPTNHTQVTHTLSVVTRSRCRSAQDSGMRRWMEVLLMTEHEQSPMLGDITHAVHQNDHDIL